MNFAFWKSRVNYCKIDGVYFTLKKQPLSHNIFGLSKIKYTVIYVFETAAILLLTCA